MENTLELLAFGKKYDVWFRLDTYSQNQNLYVGIVTMDKEYLCEEPFSDLTVNLGVCCESNCAFIDVNNNGWKIVDWLVENCLGERTGRFELSGFCCYPEFRFDMTELKKYVAGVK